MGKFLFSNQKGQAVILTSAVCLLLLVMLALVVDMGNLYLQKTKLQTAVDAAALAGAQSLPGSTAKARDAANQYMLNNGVTTTATIAFAESNTKIIVTVSQNVPTYFLRVIGTKTVAVGATATALNSEGGGGGVFSYGVFSGSSTSTLLVNGHQTIDGSVRANADIILNGSPTVTGSVEAVRSIIKNGNVSVGATNSGVSALAMPDFSTSIKADAQAAGRVYNGSQDWGNSGGYTFDGPTYVNGSVNLNGTTTIGSTGALMAKGSITINGNTYTADGSQQMSLYSTNGDITLNGAAGPIQGAIYAPNGRVILNGILTVNGSIVAKEIVMNGITVVNRRNNPITSLPVGGSIKLVK